MDQQDPRPAIDRLLRSVAARSPDHDWNDVTHLLGYGEEEEAVDVLIATLVHDAVPVSADEREQVRELVATFRFTREQATNYRYVALEMLDRLNVVDTDAPST